MSDSESHHSNPENDDLFDTLDTHSSELGSIDFPNANKTVTDRDYFDDVIDLEATYSQLGFQKGKVDALKRAQAQGVGLGFEYGHEMGEEIGFYTGLCLGLLNSFLIHSQENEDGTTASTTTTNPLTTPPPYNIDLTDQTLTLDEIKTYNKDYFNPLLEDQKIITSLKEKLSFSKLKYTSIITELINLLSLAQSIRFMPGETGDVHLVTDLRSKSTALFARLGAAGVFKDDNVIDF